MIEINYACEGRIDSAIAKRLILHVGGKIGIPREAGGKSKLDPLVPKFLNAARHQQMKWLILRDLDRDGHCAPELRGKLLVDDDPHLCFRIAVRQAESWLMADFRKMAEFLRVSENRIPTSLDQVENPKEMLVSLARRSRRSDVKTALVPHPRSGLSTGPEYASWMASFAAKHWNLADAVNSQRSPSLTKAISRLQELVHL
ncbi:MAG: hypothetical protein HY245_04690 [Rhizobiales bacterium]|nr:hypothetical protein [Hyphomicrobiales bacterium]MBI3672711.1 hypothetical protein [Hyphomicrobiales bacterium]